VLTKQVLPLKQIETIGEVTSFDRIALQLKGSATTVSVIREIIESPPLRPPGTAANTAHSSAAPNAATADLREMAEALSPFVCGLNNYPYGPDRRDPVPAPLRR
jgi:hypothetical protein